MGKQKISHAAYAAWDYKKEIEDLNKKSQEGWQLVKGGCFKSIYEQNDQVCYRYQLDYNTDIENKVLYLEMFEDQGWEYINSTFNGWHFSGSLIIRNYRKKSMRFTRTLRQFRIWSAGGYGSPIVLLP